MFALLALLACTSTHEEAPSVAAPPEPPPVASEAPADSAPVSANSLAAAQTELGLRLLAELSQDDRGNLALSPASLGHALTMTWAGARGSTAAQLGELLGLPADSAGVHEAARLLREATQLEAEGATVLAASRLWADGSLPIEAPYLALTESAYGAPLASVDFLGAPDAARGEINAWVGEHTQGHVQGLLPEGSVTDQTRLVLTDAVWFKGSWTEPFDPKATQDAPFTLASGEAVQVPTMRRTGRVAHAHLSGVSVVRLPYGDGQLSMSLILPDDPATLAGLEGKLDAAAIEALLGSARPREVALSLPRVSLRSASSLSASLSALGASEAFSDSADFSGITGDAGLKLSAVLQEVTLELDEQGTEASAATGVVAGVKSAPLEPIALSFDRPFLFLIRDRQTGAVLFLGRVADPRG